MAMLTPRHTLYVLLSRLSPKLTPCCDVGLSCRKSRPVGWKVDSANCWENGEGKPKRKEGGEQEEEFDRKKGGRFHLVKRGGEQYKKEEEIEDGFVRGLLGDGRRNTAYVRGIRGDTEEKWEKVDAHVELVAALRKGPAGDETMMTSPDALQEDQFKYQGPAKPSPRSEDVDST